MILGPASPVKWVKVAVRIAMLVLVVALIYVGVTFVQVYRASHHDGARPAAAIVVLGAAQYDGRPSPVLQGRLDHAHELWEEGMAPLVVVTGGRKEGDRFTEAEASHRYLNDLGVPDPAILREPTGKNTWEQLARSAVFLRERGITDVLLVTDGYHAYRVRAVAQELGLAAAVSPTSSRMTRSERARALMKETAAVSVGRIIGFGRLVQIDRVVDTRRR